MELSEHIVRTYTAILEEELVSAMGCTEPIAIAYAASVARHALGEMPARVEIGLSGNIIKNVKSVIVPATGGMHGIAAAVVGQMRWVYLNAYLADHTVEEALYIPRAYEKFYTVRCLEAAQSVLFALFFAAFLLCLWWAICRLDGQMEGAILGVDRRQYLIKSLLAFGFSLLMAGLGIADAIFQSDVRFLWWLTLCAFAATLFALRSLMMDARDEIFSCAREEELHKNG